MSKARYVMGVDFGATKINYTLFDAESGELLKSYLIKEGPFFRENPKVDHVVLDEKLHGYPDGTKVSMYLKEETGNVLDIWGCVPEDFSGAGMSVAGKVFNNGSDGSSATFIGGNTPERYTVKDVYGQLCVQTTGGMKELFGKKPVIAANDCNCTGNAQSWYYGKMGVDPMKTYYMVISTGIGGGGAMMAVDEIGHTKIFGVHPYVSRQCNCKEHGCLESYASGTGIPLFAKKFLDLPPEKLAEVFQYEKLGGRIGMRSMNGSGDPVQVAMASPLAAIDCMRSGDVFINAALDAESGDPFSRYMVETCAEMTANSIANAVNIHGLEVIGIGGSVASNNPLYIGKINEFTNDLIGGNSKFSPRGVKVEVCPMGDAVNDYGPASLVLEDGYKANWVDAMIRHSGKQ
jgi:predicted NBD/HSP70 family sugar kinase